MKNQMTFVLAILLATISISIAGPDKDALIAKEKTIWQAFKDKKADDFKKMVSPDVVAVYADGIYNMQQEMEAMKKTDMKSFSLSDFNVVMTDPDTAIVSYKAKVEGTVEGKDDSGNYNCASIWQLKNSEWHAIFHSDMKAEKAEK
jgi:hypothetical protein